MDFHWLGDSRGKVKSFSPASSRLSATARHFSRHLRRKARRRCSTSFGGRGVDHVGVVGRDLLVERLRRVGQQVAVLVDRAPLGRHLGPQRGQRPLEPGRAVDDEELGRAQAARDEVVEQGPPGGLALAAHALDGEQHLLPVAADAEHHQQGEAGGLAVEAHPDHRPVEDQADDVLAREVAPVPGLPVGLQLAPGAADDVLADRAPEQRGQGTPHPPRVGTGQVGAGDQGLDLAGHASVARQGGAA